MNYKLPKEWLEQSNYDFVTAKAMYDTGRYIYSIFMCHLSVEKILKGLFAKQLNQNPPKTHDLVYLTEKIHLDLSHDLQQFLDDLNDLSIPTRYPDELKTLLKQYNRNKTKQILKQTENILKCLRKKY